MQYSDGEDFKASKTKEVKAPGDLVNHTDHVHEEQYLSVRKQLSITIQHGYPSRLLIDQRLPAFLGV